MTRQEKKDVIIALLAVWARVPLDVARDIYENGIPKKQRGA